MTSKCLPSADTASSFAERLCGWQQKHGRHGLPWQVADPYRIWVSEIMLQQTQVVTVLDYYPRFIARFADVAALAQAPQEEVLALWAGLGYYSRARNLHKAAQLMHAEGWPGRWPRERCEWERLPGVGRSTAAAITAFAFRQPETILDGNVKRVLCRVFALDGVPNTPAFERELWAFAETLLPRHPEHMPAYTQGLMDLGATVCTRSRPDCGVCPFNSDCQAFVNDSVALYPRKKAPTKVAEQSLLWLLVRAQNGQTVLQRRPDRGIWGGMAVFPTFDNEAAMQQWLGEAGIDTKPVALPPVIHRLTHRKLTLYPWLVTLKAVPSSLPEHCFGVLSGSLKAHPLPQPAAALARSYLLPVAAQNEPAHP